MTTETKALVQGPAATVSITSESKVFPASYIEKDFPVEDLTPIVTKEVNSKKPIYQIHKWWARRLSSVFRMILITSSSSPEESRRTIWAKYSSNYSLSGLTVLDGMMGGGTTVVESLRLGAKVIGVDINPVAWFVTKKETEPLDQTAVEAAFQQLAKKVAAEIREYYKTKCHEGHDSQVMYAIWHKRLRCEECGDLVRILPEYLVSEKTAEIEKKSQRNKQTKRTELVIFCPACGEIFRKNQDIRTVTTCPACRLRFNPRDGTSKNGIISCRECGHKEHMLHAVMRNGGRLDFELFCVEYYCEHCGKRGYKRPSHEDQDLYSAASEELARIRSKLPYPREAIPGRMKERPRNHGYHYFHELFNDRQLLCLAKLLQAIMEIQERNTREFMLLAFSASLETNNIFCKYETRWQKCSAMFGLPGYHPVDRYAENNVWGTKFGRGTFQRSYLKMLRAKAQNHDLTTQETLRPFDEKNWFTQLADSFNNLKHSDRRALLRCQTSESIDFIPDGSIDTVATDPPYFDNLNYSSLADFFYVWLRIPLKDDYESFGPATSAREREVIMGGTGEKKREEFVESLSKIFKQYKRVLKQNRPMVFTFHHTQGWAWHDLLKAVTDGGFSIVACHFIRSEGKTGFRKSGHISYDACLVCRKSEEVPAQERPMLVRNRSKMWVSRLFRSQNGLEDSDVLSIVMGNLLTYTPSLVLNGLDNEKRIQVFEECVELKNRLENTKEGRVVSDPTVLSKSSQSKLIA